MAEQDSTEIFADGVDKTACSACGNVIDVAGVPPFTIVQCDKCKTKMAVPGMFGPYQLFKCLGKGGYGATYRGIEKFLKRPVAIKVIRSSCAKNEQVVEDFFREARILASLNHPNVAHVYSLGVHKEQPYIVMELVGGGRMDRLFRNKPLDETKALDIAMSQPLLKSLKLNAAQCWLEHSADGPRWRIRLWAAKIKHPADQADVGEVFISTVDGAVVKADLHPNRAD